MLEDGFHVAKMEFGKEALQGFWFSRPLRFSL